MAIRIENLSFNYENTQVLDNVNIEFSSKKISVLKGENGAGKTTLSKIIMGIEKDFKGEIELFSKNIKDMDLSDIAKDIYYVFQNPERQLFCETVYEEVAFALKYRNKSLDKIENILKDFGLWHLKDEYPMNLSGGEKQRLIIAVGISLNPKFMILDEPTSSLDEDNILLLIKLLKSLKIGMLIITHDKKFAEKIADDIYFLKGGKIHARR